MNTGSYVTVSNGSAFTSSPSVWHYYKEDNCGYASRFNAVRIDSTGKVIEKSTCGEFLM